MDLYPRTTVEWPVNRGDPKGNQYSPLAQIHAANVHQLEPAWEYRTGDAAPRGSSMYSNPINVDGLLYFSTPALNAVALDAATGREVWKFDSSRHNQDNAVIRLRNRGVTHWKGEAGVPARIFHFVKEIGRAHV